jgi:hypothetical protein
MPEQQAIVSGPTPQPYITVSNVVVAPGNTTFTVSFDTDVACMMELDWWSQNDPSMTASYAENEGVTRTHHTMTTSKAATRPGFTYGWSLRLDTNDTSGYLYRALIQGVAQCTGARAAASQTVPVRFYAFGGNGSPPPGGTGGQGGGTGNWSTYTWAQYNPKRTTYPTP